MNSNRIPESLHPVLSLGERALAGLAAKGASTGLTHTDDAKLSEKMEALLSSQASYLELRTRHAAARAILRSESAAGRGLCAGAIDMLKGHLGRRWNARWMAVGFTQGSIALPADPLPILKSVAAYLRTHPEHENLPLQVTAHSADEMATALVAAQAAADAARTAEAAAKRARDIAFRELRHTLSSLRSELAILLQPTDARWYDFGFHRPADGRLPEPVEELIVRAATEGETIAKWMPSARAESYRVTVRAEGSEEAPREVGLFKDPEAHIAGLPRTGTIIVTVSARNRAGETKAVEYALTMSAPDFALKSTTTGDSVPHAASA
jgi:hypothetical protein